MLPGCSTWASSAARPSLSATPISRATVCSVCVASSVMLLVHWLPARRSRAAKHLDLGVGIGAGGAGRRGRGYRGGGWRLGALGGGGIGQGAMLAAHVSAAAAGQAKAGDRLAQRRRQVG